LLTAGGHTCFEYGEGCWVFGEFSFLSHGVDWCRFGDWPRLGEWPSFGDLARGAHWIGFFTAGGHTDFEYGEGCWVFGEFSFLSHGVGWCSFEAVDGFALIGVGWGFEIKFFWADDVGWSSLFLVKFVCLLGSFSLLFGVLVRFALKNLFNFDAFWTY